MQASGHTPIWSGQRVERTNSRGYHTYVAPFKDWLIQQALQPGMSLAGLAMSNQVNANCCAAGFSAPASKVQWLLLHQACCP